ncbi:MAG: nitroreductase family protein [Pseudomonadales bacterium]
MTYETGSDADFSLRDPVDGVAELFHQRWSPRAFEKRAIANADLLKIMDAARWAPSCYNEQPWFFLTSTDSSFDTFLSLLMDGNQAWAKSASLLGFILCDNQFARNGKENNLAQFDTGAAWMAMTLQARMLGLYTHGMAGIKKDEIYTAFDIDRDKQTVIAGFALGVRAAADALPEALQEREIPSERKPLTDIWSAVE